jgi:broad specificity phosphatase PhoE
MFKPLLALLAFTTIATAQMSYEPPSRKRIYLMRHGDVSYFDAKGQVVANPDLVNLNALGIKQAEAAGISGTVKQIDALREIKNGSSSAIKTEDLPKAILNFTQNRVGANEPFIGGETVGSMQARIYPAFEAIMREEKADTVLVVLHGVVNIALVSKAITGQDEYFGKFESGSGCMHILDMGKNWGESIVRAYNYCPLSDNYTGSRVSTLEKLLQSALKGR